MFKWKLVASLAYILLFPATVLLWKIPYWIQRQRSWLAVVGAAHVVSNLVTGWRQRLAMGSTAMLAGLVILLFDSPLLLYPSMIFLFCWFSWLTYRLVHQSIFGPSFLAQQNKAIAKVMNREGFREWTAPPQELLVQTDELYSKEQITSFSGKLTLAIGINRGLYIWAYQLQRYRRTPASLLFAILDFVGLFVRGILTFAALNWALYKMDPSEYLVTSEPSFVRMTLYAMSRLMFSDGGGVAAEGDLASLLALLNGFVGFVVFAAVGLTLVMTVRPDRESASANRAVLELKRRAQEQERLMQAHYNVGVEEAIVRLRRLGQDVTFMIEWMTRSIPPDFFLGDSGEDQPR